MKHDDLDIDTKNTPMSEVKLTKCPYCKGTNGFTCTLAKRGKSYIYACSPIFELICPRVRRAKT